MKNKNISSRQMIITIVIFRVTMAMSYLTSLDFPPCNQDNWMILLFSVFYIILFSMPLLFLTNRFNNFDMIEYFSIVLGKWIGKIMIVLYGVYFLLYTLYLTILEVQLIGTNLLPDTAYWLTITMLLITSLYILSKGMIMTFWSEELIGTLSLVGLILLLVLGFKDVDMTELLPVLKDSTLRQINKGSFLSSLIFVDIFVLTMGGKFLEDKRQINKTFLKSVIYSIILVIAIMIVIQTTLGVEQAKHTIYPFLSYSRLIQYDATLERIDIIYTITWLGAHTGKIAIYLLFSSMCFKTSFNIKRGKWIGLVLAILIGTVSNFITIRELMAIKTETLKSFLYIPFVFTTILPFFICAVYFFRKKTLKNIL